MNFSISLSEVSTSDPASRSISMFLSSLDFPESMKDDSRENDPDSFFFTFFGRE